MGRTAAAGTVLTLALLGAAPATTDTIASARPAPDGRTVHAEYFEGPHSHGRTAQVPARSPRTSRTLSATEAAADGDVTVLSETGPSATRLDVTIIGDGYTLAQQADFLADARAKWADVTAIEPYKSYTGLMNVRAVGAVSNQSGISGDPTADVVRDTALGSYFWCDGIERLVCADLDRVKAYADRSPATDLVIVVADSAKYGGAGYQQLQSDYGYAGVSTLSSDHPSSSLIATHEIGHSIGFLADEYTYDTYGTYRGREVPNPNATVYTAGSLLARQAKWYRWLGAADPTGGTVGTYEGADYYPYGIYRPTSTSIMRTLASHEFNLPSREALIAGFYDYASLLADAPTQTVTRDTALSLDVPALGALAQVRIRWYADGREVPAARGALSVTPAQLGQPHTVQVRVDDATAAIRDAGVRDGTVAVRSWAVRG